MVYCGKPSKGCQMCRTRRIKCDETKPTCNQCAKSRRQCPGYKDDFDIIFRNETQATERRARRSTNNKRMGGSSGGPKQLDHPHVSAECLATTAFNEEEFYYYNSGAKSNQLASVHGALKIPLEQQALCYFLSNWVLMPRENSTRGYLDCLIPMIKTEEPGGHLSIAFTAVGLAALGNRPHSKRLLPLAGAKYAQALNLTNAALRDPVKAKTDQTLASVLLLGLFEHITSCRKNLGGWGSHVDGAVAIIKMRGKKSLRTQAGKALFINVRAHMIINCMSNSKSPEMGTEWWIADAVKDDIAQQVTRLNLRVAELRADINAFMPTAQRTPEDSERMTTMMRRAQSMDRDFSLWEAELPEEWKPKAVAWLDSVQNNDYMNAPIYPGKVEMYADIWQASVWNMQRASRLIVSGIIIRCAAWLCAPTDYRTTPEYATSARQGAQMISDMVSSVPFHLGWTFDSESGRIIPGDLSGFACGGESANGRALGGFFTLWPLFSANCSDFATDAQRKYITGRMRFIANTMGINQASVLSYIQLRLPSMVVRRDGGGIALPTSKTLSLTTTPSADLPITGTLPPLLPAPSESNTTIGAGSVDAAKISAGGAGISYPKASSSHVTNLAPAPVSAPASAPAMGVGSVIHSGMAAADSIGMSQGPAGGISVTGSSGPPSLTSQTTSRASSLGSSPLSSHHSPPQFVPQKLPQYAQHPQHPQQAVALSDYLNQQQTPQTYASQDPRMAGSYRVPVMNAPTMDADAAEHIVAAMGTGIPASVPGVAHAHAHAGTYAYLPQGGLPVVADVAGTVAHAQREAFEREAFEREERRRRLGVGRNW